MKSEPIFVIIKDDLYGFINSLGCEVIPPRFKSASEFREGYAIVETFYEGKGLLEKTGAFLPLDKKVIFGPPMGG
jgi:hypothetical protein